MQTSIKILYIVCSTIICWRKIHFKTLYSSITLVSLQAMADLGFLNFVRLKKWFTTMIFEIKKKQLT